MAVASMPWSEPKLRSATLRAHTRTKFCYSLLLAMAIISSFTPFACPALEARRHKRERAFDLLRIETEFDESDEGERLKSASRGHQGVGSHLRRDEALDDEKCQKRCNERIRSGLDMVKAHTAFGSVGVPSVIDHLDLQMFCRLDAEHDKCLRDCGYEVQFNMRNYVCKDRYSDMVANLGCYAGAAPRLKRECGEKRCGPFHKNLEASLTGYAQRCRTLQCDLSCTRNVLVAECGEAPGTNATKFLVDYSRVQVMAWMKDISKSTKRSIPQIIPTPCSRIFCEGFATNKNCSSVLSRRAA